MRVLIVPADRTEPHGGARNLGDAFLSDVLAAGIEARGHQVDIYDFGGTDRRTTGRTRLRGGRGVDLFRHIQQSDAVLIGGGTMLQDDQGTRLFAGLPRLCAVVSSAARVAGVPVAFYGVGLDTVQRRVPRLLLQSAVSKRPVWVRDAASQARFEIYFSGTACLGADASLLLPETAINDGTSVARSGALIALNRTDAQGLTPDLVNALMAAYGTVRFLSMDQEEGNADADSLSRSARKALRYEPEVLSWHDAARQIAKSEIVLASRMHALYMAALWSVPVVALGNSDKLRAFALEFGVPLLAHLSAWVPGAERVACAQALAEARQRAAESLDAALVTLGES